MRVDGGSEVEILHYVGANPVGRPKAWPSGAWMSQAAAIEALDEQSSTLMPTPWLRTMASDRERVTNLLS